jgi:hypothetical protein
MTTWYPDTCGCSIEYTDDGNFSWIASHANCPKHASLSGAAHLSAVQAHNGRRNNVINYMLGQGYTNVTAQYDAADNLNVTLHGVAPTAVTLNTLRTNAQAAYPGTPISVAATAV